MEVRILGPFEIAHGGALLPIPGRLGPKTLVVLLSSTGHTVSVDRLVDALWDDDAPATARRQVTNILAALRRAFDPFDPDLLQRRSGAYRLGECDLDARRFDELVRQARTAREAGDGSKAAELLDTALDLWRGPPLVGLDGRYFENEARRLEESRLSALDARMELALDLGTYGQVINLAGQVLDAYPMRQSSVAPLMLALHHCGRTNEAFSAFLRLRDRLREDMGIDPNDALVDLYQRILRNEVPPAEPVRTEPAPLSPAPPSPAAPTPAQLPVDISNFVGRDAELDRLDELLDTDGEAVTTLTGAGGSGKTALAVHWGHLRRDRFGDGQLYVNLRGYDTGEPVEPLNALHAMLRGLGVPGESVSSDVAEAAALYRSLLADRHALVVLDNARSASQVRPLLPGGEQTMTIVTSRDRLGSLTAVQGARPITLESLHLRDAVDLLASMVGPDRLLGDPEAAHRIAELCGRLPLALRVAGANLAGRTHDSVAGFADRLAQDNDRLALLAVDGDPEVALTAVFDQSFAALSPASQALLCRLGALPGVDFSADLIDVVGAGAALDTEQALAQLVSAHLLERYRPERYRFHDLMGLYAKQQHEELLSPLERRKLIDRFIEWHHDSYRVEEFDNIVDACRQWSDHPKVWRLAVALRPQLSIGYGLPLIRELARHALAAAEPDRDGMAQMHRLLAGTNAFLGDLDSAVHHGRVAVELMQDHEGGDVDGVLHSVYSQVLYRHGRPHEAEPYVRKALSIAETMGHPRYIANRSYNLGVICRDLGRLAEAEREFLRCVSFVELPRRSCPSYQALAVLYLDQGRTADASRMAELALKAATEHHSSRHEALALLARGRFHLRLGDIRRGRSDLDRALEVARKYQLRPVAQWVRCYVSRALSQGGDHRRALREVKRLLAELEGGSDLTLTAECLLAAAEISLDAGEATDAVEYAERARRSFSSRHITLLHGRSLLILSRAQAALRDIDTATKHADQALGIFTEIGVPDAAEAEALLESSAVDDEGSDNLE